MKGYAILGVNEHGWVEKEKPVAGPLDAVLRPVAVTPCTSDVHNMHLGAEPNRIMCHECVAEVVEVGSLVNDFKPGDIVVVSASTPNWEEVNLQRRNSNNAHGNAFMSSAMLSITRDGAFAEFFLVNNADANLVLLPEGVSVDAALMAVDMMSTGFYGAEMADIQMGDTVVVFGIGPVGLMAVAGAKLRGAGRIIAVGTRPNCIELAKEYGATDFVSYKDGDIAEQVLSLEKGKVDSVILAGGNMSSLNQALSIVKPNGTIANINFMDVEDSVCIPALQWGLGMADITIRGGMCPGGAYRIMKLLNLIKNGRISPEKLLNYQFSGFDKIKDAFILMAEKPKDLIKPVVHIQW